MSPEPGLRLAFNVVFDDLAEECGEGSNIPVHAGGLKRGHVVIAAPNRDDRPWIAAGGEHYVHQEAAHAPVAVHVRVNVNQYEMPENDADGGVPFFGEKFE